jgi:N utilization substance protein B
MIADSLSQELAGSPSSRRGARRDGVFLLYQRDVTGMALEDLIANYRRSEGREPDLYALMLAEGVAVEHEAIDREIEAAAIDWSVDRLAPLERNILRVAVFEIRYVDEVPTPVAIDEAVRIAKQFCQQEAAGLVNGVLAAVARTGEESP